MRHHTSRLLKIDRWMRFYAWYYLIGGLAIGIISSAYYIFAIIYRPESMGLFPGNDNLWVKGMMIIGYVSRLLAIVFFYLFLQWASKTIHYLVSLKQDLAEKRKMRLSQPTSMSG